MGSVRKLGAKDLPRIYDVVITQKSASFNWDVNKIQAEYLTCQAYGIFNQESILVAFLFFTDLGPAIEISVLATHPRYQHQGHMYELISKVLTENCKRREVWLEVHELNLSARNLYQKIGFEEVGRRRHYYYDGGDAILYSRQA